MFLFSRTLVFILSSCFFSLLAPADASALVSPGTKAAAPVAATSATTVLRGRASWYGSYFQGRRTTSGERFNRFRYTCAHKSLPFNTRLRVTNVKTGKSVVVRVTDRGPFRHQRIIDLSEIAARPLGLVEAGAVTVVAEVVAQDTPLGPAASPENLLALRAADPNPAAAFTTYSVAPEAAPEAPLNAAEELVRTAATATLFAAVPAATVATAATADVMTAAESTSIPAGFFVQAGSFADAANATSVQARIKALLPDVQVTIAQDLVDGRQRSRVLVGRFGEQPEAEAIRRQMLLWGIGGLVREVALR